MNHDESSPKPEVPTGKLRQSLRGVQIFFIIVSTVIGTGVFSGNRIALAISGPLGLLLNVVCLGLLAICIGETVSELVQIWAVPNAVYYYVKSFVDAEVAWVVTLLYWYSYAAVFAVQMLGAAKLVQFWDLTSIWPPFIFYLVTPILLLALNLAGIRVYGWTETVFGMLKTVLVFGVICTLYDISTKNGYAGPDGPISSGLQHNPEYTTRKSHSFFYGIPYVAYSYIGVESSIVAAFESRDAKAIAVPSRLVHWFIFILYFMCTLGIALTVPWDDANLLAPLKDLSNPKSNSPTIIAIAKDSRLSDTPLPGFVNGCLIMSIVSSAAASLYLAGRTLYGLAYSFPTRESWWLTRTLKGLGSVWKETMVPAKALVITVIAFFWLPWLSQIQGNPIAVDDVIDVLALTASASCIITWAFLCLAFINFDRWTEHCKNALSTSGGGLSRYIRSGPEYEKIVGGLGIALQPWLAKFGVLGCIIVFISASATWWSHPANAKNVIAAYGPHAVGALLWFALKLNRWVRKRSQFEWFVHIKGDNSVSNLRTILTELETLSAWSNVGSQSEEARN